MLDKCNKITVYGGTNNARYTEREMSECEKLGKFLGRNGFEILTGACGGFPYFVGKAAIAAGAPKVVGFTPAMDLDQHINEYKFPIDGATDLVYTKEVYATRAEGFIRRSLDMAPVSSVVIAMGGSWGTFAELLFSFIYKRTIILIEEFQGAVKAFDDAWKYFGSREINPDVHNGANIIRVKNVDEAIAYLVSCK